MNLYHQHNIGDQVFVQIRDGRYLPARIEGFVIDGTQVWYETNLSKSLVPERHVLTTDQRNLRHSEYLRALKAVAEQRLKILEAHA